MSATTAEDRPRSVDETRVSSLSSRRRRPKQFDRPRFLILVSGFTILLLFLPVGVVVLYSLNSSRSLVVFQSFSLHWYKSAVQDGSIRSSLWTSAEIALITTAISAVLGTLLAFGLERGSRGLARVSEGALVARLVAPETATAVALLLVVTQLGLGLSRTTIVAGHIALCLPFVTVVVRSRLGALNAEVEDAAMDLGATRMGALRLVALPVLWPAIAGASMLAFVLSFDDFVTSYFVSGVGVNPLPVLIYSMLRFGVTPAVNAIGVMMMIITLAVVALAVPLLRLGRRRGSVNEPGEAT